MKNGSNIDLEQENRRSRVLALCSKNLTQFEIAQELKVDQSTISRDLRNIKDEAMRKVAK
jgi:DNA-binding CsgD family transcriptional regulator